MRTRESIIWPAWRINLLKKLDVLLIAFEFVLSVIFFLLSYLTNNIYFKGVAVGLLIAWATSAIAYLFKKKAPTKRVY